MRTYVSLPVTPSGCRDMSNRVEVHNTHHHITGGLTVFTYKSTIFRTFRAPQKRCCSLSLPRNAALLLSASCRTTTGDPVHCIHLVAATSLCCITMTGRVGWLWGQCGGEIHDLTDGAFNKWALGGEFGSFQKLSVGTSAQCLLYCSRR